MRGWRGPTSNSRCLTASAVTGVLPRRCGYPLAPAKAGPLGTRRSNGRAVSAASHILQAPRWDATAPHRGCHLDLQPGSWLDLSRCAPRATHIAGKAIGDFFPRWPWHPGTPIGAALLDLWLTCTRVAAVADILQGIWRDPSTPLGGRDIWNCHGRSCQKEASCTESHSPGQRV